MTQKLLAQLRVAILIIGSLLVLVALGALVYPAAAARSGPPVQADTPTNEYCLGCHAKPGMSKALPSGETLSLTIDQEQFKHSVHNDENIACVDCHTNITTFPHPAFQPETVRGVTLQLYSSCKKCHEQEYKNALDSVHQRAIAGG